MAVAQKQTSHDHRLSTSFRHFIGGFDVKSSQNFLILAKSSFDRLCFDFCRFYRSHLMRTAPHDKVVTLLVLAGFRDPVLRGVSQNSLHLGSALSALATGFELILSRRWRFLFPKHFQQAEARTFLANNKTRDNRFICLQQDETKCKS